MCNFSCKTFIVFCLCCIQFGYGQDKNELSIYGMGIFSYLDYKLNKGSHTGETGGQVGVSYSYGLNGHWSIGIGGEFQSYRSQASYYSLQDSYETVDMEGDPFIFQYQAENYIENQYASFINIPLTIRYQTRAVTGFYAMGGVKAGFPINAQYQVQMQSLRTSGYYPRWDAELEGPMFMGFGQRNRIDSGKKDLDLETSFSLLLEAGIKQVVRGNSKVFVGFFLEYGLNEIHKTTTNENLIVYNTPQPEVFEYNSIFTSTNKEMGSSYADNVRMLAYGVKLRYSFSWKSKKQRTNTNEK
ncbi:hypothetical protein OOZ15_19095 [Galbibacter sp. EGI 63066]|uniref:hypothetical protein n=1 Tax=Galbibacter sp. EGI 63066 TaxID=2993559 RepID=UPI00224904B5|nr:hypothetical protein [Galbibacter sp. EGI 63066]MCX2682065.1 hypothetical protein [Galbibacter sp. EGI 63066]